jgi:hypothetical protein
LRRLGHDAPFRDITSLLGCGRVWFYFVSGVAAVLNQSGYTLQVTDRTTAAMQLAAHFTQEAMKHSASDDPRERLAEQLGYFDLAFRSIMGTTARAMIKTGATPPEEDDGADRLGVRAFAFERP